MTFEDLSRRFATFYRRTFCWIHGCSLLFFLTMTNQQQQFLPQQFFRQEQQPQQWAYYFHGGQTAQPQQQPQQQHYQFVYSPERRQFQLLPIQQNQPTSTPQFSAFQQQSTGNSQFQQPQQFFPQQQQQQQFQPQFQQQFPQSTQTQFPVFQQNNFPQNQFSQSPQNQFQQPQFQQEQQTTQAAFQQPLADQQQLPDWFVRSSGPGEFQGELPELIRPPMIHHVQREQDLPSLSRPAPPAPPTQQHQQQQFAFPTQPQQQIQPPVPPPRIVHIQPEQLQSNEAQQIHELLPQLLLSTQRPTTRRPPTTTTARRTRRPMTPRALIRAPPTPPPAILIKEETKPPSVEFAADLPPPPPARFLPESEKVRIAELIRQNNRIRNNQAIHAGAITDFPTLATKPPPPTPASTKPTTRKSTLARLAVQEATTFVPVDIAGGQKDPNRVFLDCCRRKRVAKICESRCNFDVLNKKILTGMFLGSDKCPTEFGLDLFTCAAQDSDHTTCCREKRVHTTGAGDKCLAFCNLAPEAPRIQLDASYLPCWAVLNEVKTCFRDNIVG